MPFELIAEKLVYGGDALGYFEGRPVMVSRALPGERLEAELVRTAKGVAHARPLRILDRAPGRVEPPCPYFGRCGGCQYQHLKAEDQAAVKVEILRETLGRIGKVRWEAEIPTRVGPAWNYRNQAQFKVTPSEDGRCTLGFFEAESHRVVPVDACLIVSPRINAVLEHLRAPEWCEGSGACPAPLTQCREIEVLADDRDDKVMLTLGGVRQPAEAEKLARCILEKIPGAETVAFEWGKGFRVSGKPQLGYQVGEFRYRISPGSFFQASRFLLPELLRAVTSEDSPGSLAPGGRDTMALDLFAGAGLFALPLARRFGEVLAVEAHARSARDLAANARAYGLENIRPTAETAEDFLRRCARPEPELVVLDPPRAGVGPAALKSLAALRPRRILYVSCSPPTLARDLGTLLPRGFRLDSIEMFDFFPQTYHIECLARLTRHLPRSS